MPITRRSQVFAGMGAGPATAIIQAASKVASTTSALALSQINGVTIRSQISPDLDLTAAQAVGGEPPAGGLDELFMRIVKPSIYVDTSLGTFRITPWGEPTLNLYPVLLIGAIVGIGALAGILWKGMQK
jgi:hypothetical protein